MRFLKDILSALVEGVTDIFSVAVDTVVSIVQTVAEAAKAGVGK